MSKPVPKIPAFIRHSQEMMDRLEFAVLPTMFGSVLKGMRENRNYRANPHELAWVAATYPDFEEAAAQAVDGLPKPTGKGVRVFADTVAAYALNGNGISMAPGALLMATVYWTKTLIDADYLVLYEGSPFERGYKFFWDEVMLHHGSDRWSPRIKELDGFADQIVPVIKRRMKVLGLLTPTAAQPMREAA